MAAFINTRFAISLLRVGKDSPHPASYNPRSFVQIAVAALSPQA
jgi:hypothetical protein